MQMQPSMASLPSLTRLIDDLLSTARAQAAEARRHVASGSATVSLRVAARYCAARTVDVAMCERRFSRWLELDLDPEQCAAIQLLAEQLTVVRELHEEVLAAAESGARQGRTPGLEGRADL